MSVEEVALYYGHVESLKKSSTPVNWREGFLSIICLPKPVTSITASGSQGIETTFSPIDYNDSIRTQSALDPLSEYGLFFYSPSMPSQMTSSISLLSLHTMSNKPNDEADNIYEELPTNNESNSIFKKQLSLKQLKSKGKKKVREDTSTSITSIHELPYGKSVVLLPLLPSNVDKCGATIMSSIKYPHKSLKAGVHYPIWVQNIIIFNGRYQSSQSLSSLLTNTESIPSQIHPAHISSTKLSLKQKLFGNRNKKSGSNDMANHSSSSQESQCPIIIGFRSVIIAKMWWQRIQDILSRSKTDHVPVSTTMLQIPMQRTSVFLSVDSNQNQGRTQYKKQEERKLENAYASLPRRMEQNSSSLQGWLSSPSVGSGLSISDKVQHARATRKMMVLKDATQSGQFTKKEELITFSALLLTVPSNGKMKKSLKNKLFSAATSFSFQVIIPYGLRLLIPENDSLVHFDILAASIVRYSFFENIFLLELMERCLLSVEKELLFQVEAITMFQEEFLKLVGAFCVEVSLKERPSGSFRDPPKPQLSRNLKRSSSTSENDSNPDDHVYAELHSHDQPRVLNVETNGDSDVKTENQKILSCVNQVENVEDPYNEGDIHGFIEM